jgi:copper oxidase (laccase) domain-containing protein
MENNEAIKANELQIKEEGGDSTSSQIEILPWSSPSKFQISPQVTEALIQKNPEALLSLIQNHQMQQREDQQQKYDLNLAKLRCAQELAIKAEERKTQSEKSSYNLICFGVIAFICLFSGVLFYSAKAQDKSLPGTIFTSAMSAVAGGGIVLAKSKGSKKEDNEN